MKKWTRRKFLETGLAGSIAAGGTSLGDLAASQVASRPPRAAAAAESGFDSAQIEMLRAAMDEIIPASDGMPAASEVGAVEYLDHVARDNPEIKSGLTRSLSELGNISQKNFAKSFVSLSSTERIQALAGVEKGSDPSLFAALQDYVYEAYYTQPKVWKLIGYEFSPTNESGPHLKPFDEAALAHVRRKPKFYREVS